MQWESSYEFLNIVSPRGRKAGHFRPACRLCHRAGYIENLQETGEGLCPGIFFFFFYFFSLFSLYFRRGKDANWSKGKEKRKRDKLYRLRNSGNRPWRQSGERSRPVYFFFLCFPASYFTRGKNANWSEEKNKLYLFSNSGNRPLRRISERLGPGYLLSFFFLTAIYFTLGRDANWSEGKEKRKKEFISVSKLGKSSFAPDQRSFAPSLFCIFFLSDFPLATSRMRRMRIGAKEWKKEKKNKLYLFCNSGNVPGRYRAGLRAILIARC